MLPPSKRKRLKIHRKNRLKTKRRLHVVCSPTDGRGRLIFALAYPWKKSDAGQRWIIINRALAQSNTNRTMAQPNRILIEKWASPMGYRSNAGQRQTNSKRILTWAIATIFFKNLGNAPSKNIDFVHRSGALARPGNQKLCAVKFSAFVRRMAIQHGCRCRFRLQPSTAAKTHHTFPICHAMAKHQILDQLRVPAHFEISGRAET